jgi:hypothetical protein
MVAAMLERLTADKLAPAIGDTFILKDDQIGGLDLVLLEARTLEPDAPPEDASGKRAPFRLEFRGPLEPVMAQRIYRLQHDSLGTLEIFIVPIASDDAETRYEAIFA